jgi:hypothetical protein
MKSAFSSLFTTPVRRTYVGDEMNLRHENTEIRRKRLGPSRRLARPGCSANPGRPHAVPARAVCRLKNVIAIALAAPLLGCAAPAVKRDLSAIPVGQVGFDDMCGLQEYFDEMSLKMVPPPDLVEGADIEHVSKSTTARGGRARFAFQTPFQLATVRRVLDENWKNLPPKLNSAKRIDLAVNWSERAGLHRVANDSKPELFVDGVATPLPYHVCLSELLFGEPLYRQRRALLGLPPLTPSPTSHPVALPPAPSPIPAPGAGAAAPSPVSSPAASPTPAH